MVLAVFGNGKRRLDSPSISLQAPVVLFSPELELSLGSPASPAPFSSSCAAQQEQCSALPNLPLLSKGEEKAQTPSLFLLPPPLLPAGQGVTARRGGETGTSAFGGWRREVKPSLHPLFSPNFPVSWRDHIKQESRGRWQGFHWQ